MNYVLRNVFVIICVLCAMPNIVGAAQSTKEYRATIRVIGCARDAGQRPRVWASSTIVPPSGRTELESTSGIGDAGIWVTVVSVPVLQHRYIWINTPHCAAHVAAVSLGRSRDFIVALQEGGGGNIDERDAYIAGRLPFPGVTSVDLVSPATAAEPERLLRHAVIDDEVFYIENVPAGKYAVKVTLANGSAACFPLTTFDRAHPSYPFHRILRINAKQFVDKFRDPT